MGVSKTAIAKITGVSRPTLYNFMSTRGLRTPASRVFLHESGRYPIPGGTASMNVHVLQHVAFEGLGSMAQWLDAAGLQTSYTRFFADDPLPALDRVDMLIALGGPMSVNDEAALPWLAAEKQFVRDVVAQDIPVLGVCLGAQLIASALGARVFRGAVKEIGWFPIRGVSTTPTSAFRFPAECLVFHWHGETFDLPENATWLAESAGCANQAFQLKHNVIGLQFHLETTAESTRALVEHCRDELVPGPYVQGEQELRATPASRYTVVNRLMSDVLAYLTRPAGSPGVVADGRRV